MATTEHERLELYELAKHEVGERFAELMMKSLPQDPDELVRKADLADVEQRLDARISVLGSELRVEMRDLTSAQTRTMTLGLVGSVTALAITQIVASLIAR